MNQKIISFIQSNLDKGYNEEKIKKALSQSGYSEKVVNEHFDYIRNGSGEKFNINKILNIKVIGVFFILLILAFGVYYLSIYFFSSETAPEEIMGDNFTVSVTYLYANGLCVALAEGNIEPCEKIVDPTEVKLCKEGFCLYNLIFGVDLDCQIEDPDLKFWADIFTSQSKDERVCEQLEDLNEVINCKAIVTDDIEICSSLSDKEKAQECKFSYYHIKGIQENKAELCNKIAPESNFRDLKAFCLALTTKDSKSACESILGSEEEAS